MSTRERGSRLMDQVDVDMLAWSLRHPLGRDNAREYFKRLTPKIVRSISEEDQPTIAYILDTLLNLDILGIESNADILSNPVYLQGRLDALLDVAKVTVGSFILKEARRRTPKKIHQV